MNINTEINCKREYKNRFANEMNETAEQHINLIAKNGLCTKTRKMQYRQTNLTDLNSHVSNEVQLFEWSSMIFFVYFWNKKVQLNSLD